MCSVGIVAFGSAAGRSTCPTSKEARLAASSDKLLLTISRPAFMVD